jgi:hypothetical protein
VLLLNAVSVYTTASGLQLAWREGGFFSTVVMPWGLAIAIGSLLVFLTIEAGFRNLNVSRNWVVVAYLVLAAVSIFFNFNYIYSSMTAGEEEREALLSLETLQASLHAQVIDYARDVTRVENIRKQLEDSKTEMDIEKARPDRPGEGWRWIGRMAAYQRLNGNLRVAREKYDEFVQRYSGRSKSFDLKRLSSFDEIHSAVEAKRQEVLGYLAELRALPQFQPKLTPADDILLGGGNRKDLWYTFDVISRSSVEMSHGDWSPRSARVVIAFIFSLVIDLPIFFAVFVVGKRERQAQRPAEADRPGRKGLWQEGSDLWGDLEP